MVLREAQLFAPVKAWFEERGYDVFAEVPCYASSIDLVALHGDIVIAVELKTALTKQVIHQARRNDMFADASYAAVGTNPRNIQRCADARIGLLTVNGGVVAVRAEPCLRYPMLLTHQKQRILDQCASGACPDVGGVPCLEGRGPAQDCKARCDAYKVDHPGATWREMFVEVPNHYASHNSMWQSLTTGLETHAYFKALRKSQKAESERKQAFIDRLIADTVEV